MHPPKPKPRGVPTLSFVSELLESVLATVRQAGERLRAAGVDPEDLATYVPERRRLLIKRRATMLPVGYVWRLGSLLVGADGADPALFVAGRATRAAVRPHPGNQSVSLEERRDLAAAALHGGFPEGASVHFDAVEVPLTEAGITGLAPELPLGIVAGELRVRWRAGAALDGAQTLAAYLDERVELLAHPPQGAN